MDINGYKKTAKVNFEWDSPTNQPNSDILLNSTQIGGTGERCAWYERVSYSNRNSLHLEEKISEALLYNPILEYFVKLGTLYRFRGAFKTPQFCDGFETFSV